MSSDETQFVLPQNIERYLASLSKLYAQEGKTLQQEIIVNSTVRVREQWSYDNWDGGVYGHALYLVVPEALYLRCAGQKDDLQSQIKADLKKVHNLRSEFVAEVFLEMELAENRNWRKDSGLLLTRTPTVLPEAETRIWGNQIFHLFLSHKAEYKKPAADLKDALSCYGISCFVAHEDIEPTREWQDEIEKALFSMDALAALMTEDFFASPWTNQEIGVAIGRGTPIVTLRQGSDPHGFIGKYQAVTAKLDEEPKRIAEAMYDLLWTNESLQPKLIEGLVMRLETAASYHHAIEASKQLQKKLIKTSRSTPAIIERIEKAASENGYVEGAYFVPARLEAVVKALRGNSERAV